MSDPALPGPEGMRPELLAAYADGELDPATHAAVERWLAAHPHARNELLTQRQLSPANWPFWQKAEPPLPSHETWNELGSRIAAAVRHDPFPRPALDRSRRRVGLRFAAGVAATAAALAVVWFAARPPSSPPSLPQPEVARGELTPVTPHDVAPFPIASASDVEIQRVTAMDRSALPVGELPFGGAFVLATEEDVAVEGIDEHPYWPSGGPVVVPNPGDSPMIYVTRPR